MNSGALQYRRTSDGAVCVTSGSDGDPETTKIVKVQIKSHTHTRTHKNTHTHTVIHMNTHTRIIHTNTHTVTSKHTHTHTHTLIHTNALLHLTTSSPKLEVVRCRRAFVCISVCVCITVWV